MKFGTQINVFLQLWAQVYEKILCAHQLPRQLKGTLARAIGLHT